MNNIPSFIRDDTGHAHNIHWIRYTYPTKDKSCYRFCTLSNGCRSSDIHKICSQNKNFWLIEKIYQESIHTETKTELFK